MEDTPLDDMERATKIIRRSIHYFLQNYHSTTTTPVLLMLPYSASILLLRSLSPFSSILVSIIHPCLEAFFLRIGFSTTSPSVSLLNNLISQTIFTFLFSLPLTLCTIIVAKACIIQAIQHHKQSLPPPFFSFLSLYKPLCLTHLCNSFLITIVNMTTLSLMFNLVQVLGFSTNKPFFQLVAKTIFYSFLANTLIVCNLALVEAGMEDKCFAFRAIQKAWLTKKGRNLIVLLLVLPFNLGLFAIEALFHHRVTRVYHHITQASSMVALEGIFIAYLYSLLLVLDTIATCFFFKSCKSEIPNSHEMESADLGNVEEIP
ncbi:hypothetical protein RJ641_022903 [Dillenia turbinata]|uniref:Transmembrane protein n=1 Tax=Dillenia turbinata TaxID=194707 RepID=A0AAN8UNP6_9MAGN